MRTTAFKTKMALGLLACGFCLLSLGAWADIRIPQIETDGQVRDVAASDARSFAPLPINSTIRGGGVPMSPGIAREVIDFFR